MDGDNKRGKPWDKFEVEALCAFVKDNRSKLFGSGGKGSSGVEKMKVETWRDCRSYIIASGGRKDREWDKVRKKWQDVSSKAKKYATKRRAYLNGTGGGEFVPPNDLLELVLEAIPGEVRDGITPIGSTETAPIVTLQQQPQLSQQPPLTSIGVQAPALSVQQPHQATDSSFGVQAPALTVQQQQAGSSSFGMQRPASKDLQAVQVVETKHIKTYRRPNASSFDNTETEDSQESQGEKKRRRKNKGKKVAKKETDEIDLLKLNQKIADQDAKKLEIFEGILVALQGIQGCLEKLTSKAEPSAMEILHSMQSEL